MFSKRRRHDVLLVLLFWLGALEFKILKFLFFRCLNIFLGNFPRFSVQKSFKNKSKQPTSEDTSFPGLFFTKSEGKQPVCWHWKFLEQRCDIFRLILHSWRLRFLSQWASACAPRSETSFPAKLSNETSFKMISILICTRLLVNQMAPCYVSVKSKLQHAPPRAYPGHLTPLPSRGGGNLIIRVFQGVGNLIPML